jgi:hypothetical protein
MIDLTPDRIRVRLILTEALPETKIEESRRSIIKRTGRDVDLFVRKVAGEEELALLRERLKPAPPAPLEDLDAVRRALVARLEQRLREAWPANTATLLGHELGFNPAGIVVRLQYQAPVAFDEAARAVLRNILRSRLRVEQLDLDLQWVPPEPAPTPAKKPRAAHTAAAR